MAYEEEFEEQITEQDPFSEFGGKPIKKQKQQKEENPFAAFGGTLIKKKEPSQSSTNGALPSSGLIEVKGGLTPIQKQGIPEIKPTAKAKFADQDIADALLKDKQKENSYLGALWNNVVGSMERLGRGATRLAYKFENSPVLDIEKRALEAGGAAMGRNLVASKEQEIANKVGNFIGNARLASSSKENERKLMQGFDVTNGIGWDDIKALGLMATQMVGDVGAAAATGGGSLFIQGYDDALSTIDEIDPEGKVSEGTRTAYGLGGAAIIGTLEKVGLDNILKVPGVKKKVVAQIVNETTEELINKGVKVTAKEFEEAAIKNAEKYAAKQTAKRVIGGAAKALGIEGTTEAAQEAGTDLLKVAVNKLENSEIFDQDEILDTAAQRYLNSFAAGGALGGVAGAGVSYLGNTTNAIEESLKKAKTPEQFKDIVDQINERIESGEIQPEQAEQIAPIIQKYSTVITPEGVKSTQKERVTVGDKTKGNKFEQDADGKFTAFKEGVELKDENGQTIKFNSLEEAQEAINILPKEKVYDKKIEDKVKDTESKIKRKDLFEGVGEFSRILGGSIEDSVPTSHAEKNGIEIVEFSNPKTNIVDVIISGTSENDFVGYYRIYENGEPTNKWSSKFENKSKNKDAFKTMISEVQNRLPEGHEYTEKKSISTDGLRVWNQQLSKGYELQYDKDGKLITTKVAINNASRENDLGIPVEKGDFENILVKNDDEFQKVKEALLPYLKKFGLDENNIQNQNNRVIIDLPILKQKSNIEETTVPTEQEISEPIKTETTPTEIPLSQQYQEINNIKGEKARLRAKEKVISDNFEGIVSQLMLKNKIKRICP